MKEAYTKPEVTLDEFEAVEVMTASSEGYEGNNTDYEF